MGQLVPLHLGIRKGEIANRIVSVGDCVRAALIASYLDPLPPDETDGGEAQVFKHSSKRGFTVYTGLFNGVRMSVVATGMGMAMMDFVVRECRAVVDGQMAVCRLGTCGILDASLPVGTVVVASPGSVSVRREPDAFSKPVKGAVPSPPYRISNLVESDPELSRLLMQRLRFNLGEPEPEVETEPAAEDSEEEEADRKDSASSAVGEDQSESVDARGGGDDVAAKEAGRPKVVMGLNCTADYFYSSQGRTGTHFDDRNDDLIEAILAGETSAASLEMETFHLLDLARCSMDVNGHPGVVAAAAAIGLAQRKSSSPAFIEAKRVESLERLGGISLLEALAARNLEGADNMKPGNENVIKYRAERGAEWDAEGAKGAEGAAEEEEMEPDADADESGSKEGGGKIKGGEGEGKGGGPVAWFKAYTAKTKEMAAQIKVLGLAGLTAYGIFNTVYYTLAFTAAWSFQTVPAGLGLAGTAQTAAKVMSMVWAGSQVGLALFTLISSQNTDW
jgi:uridine phosphorylase